MIEKLIIAVSLWVISVISAMGYTGIVLLMAIESACIPLPSEIIMPFSGYLVSQGEMTLWGVALAGALGCVLGSIPAYYLGLFGGRPLIETYGKYALVSKHDIEVADRAFERYGEIIVLIGRLLPVVRTFIAFPAGMARMNMTRFILYTFFGSLVWCWALAYIGRQLGENWKSIKPFFHEFHLVFAAVLVALIAWFVWAHLKRRKPL